MSLSPHTPALCVIVCTIRIQSAQDIHTSISMATRPLTVYHGGNLGAWQQKHSEKKEVLMARKTVVGVQDKPIEGKYRAAEVERDVQKHKPEEAVKRNQEGNAEKDQSAEETSLDIDQLLKDVDLTVDLHETEPSTMKHNIGLTTAEPHLMTPSGDRGANRQPSSLLQVASSTLPGISQPCTGPSHSDDSQDTAAINPHYPRGTAAINPHSDDPRGAAAIKIQRWYRHVRELHHQSQVQTLLQQKRATMAESLQAEALKVWEVCTRMMAQDSRVMSRNRLVMAEMVI